MKSQINIINHLVKKVPHLLLIFLRMMMILLFLQTTKKTELDNYIIDWLISNSTFDFDHLRTHEPEKSNLDQFPFQKIILHC
jgi:hypothetical protein